MSEHPETSEQVERRGARLTSTQRAARNRQIAVERAAGEPWDVIAARHGISERQARRGRIEHIRSGASSAALDADPNDVLREAVAIHRDVLQGLAAVGIRADNSAAQVGALRARATTALQLVHLLAWAGLVPDSAGAWRFARDLSGFVGAMVAVVERHGLDAEEVVEELDQIGGGLPRALTGAVA